MKQYLLFGFDKLRPQGGINDFIKAFDFKDEMHKFVKENKGTKNENDFDHYNSLNTKTGDVEFNF